MSSDPQPNLQQPQVLVSPPAVSIVLTAALLVAFFVGFFSVVLCRCIMETLVFGWQRRPIDTLANPANPPLETHGLDPSLVQLFPKFTYSSVKDIRREEYGLECAICLGEFSEDDELRLLIVCFHVFHQECIDLWLGSHKTCPVCRRDLDLPKEVLEKTPLTPADDTTANDGFQHNTPEHISIEIRDDQDRKSGEFTIQNGEEGNADDDDNDHHLSEQIDPKQDKNERFSRSRSTGHSIRLSRAGEQENKYTLKLLHNVKVQVINGHCATGSCITFGEFSSPLNGGLGLVTGSS